MAKITPHDSIVGPDNRVLVTGATGFIGSKLVANLLARGFRNLRCFARPSSAAARFHSLSAFAGFGNVEVMTGNLLSREDCIAVGDSREDMDADSVVDQFWLVANALDRDITLEADASGRDRVRVASESYGAGVYEAVVTTLAERR